MNFVERRGRGVLEGRGDFRKVHRAARGDPSYVFYDGPPTANGKPIGHVETRAFKDMIPRYHAMKGGWFRKAGWDTHGLPVGWRSSVGISGKEQDRELAWPASLTLQERLEVQGACGRTSYKVGFWADGPPLCDLPR